MLGTENFNTSFQSLMNPMYNINANYGGYGIGAGFGGYGMGNGGYMGGFMTPLANVGVGQFNGDYLIKNDAQNNNYYARPVAVHKKKDETGTILGIIGTALGTAALLAALRKGKPAAGVTTPTTTRPVTINPPTPSTQFALPGPGQITNMPTSPAYTQISIPGRGGTGAIIDDATKALKPGTQFSGAGSSINVPTPSTQFALPGSGQITNMPISPAYTQISIPGRGGTGAIIDDATKALKPGTQFSGNNIASSNQNAMNANFATKSGMMTPDAQAAYNNVLGRQFKPGLAKDAARKDAAMALVAIT